MALSSSSQDQQRRRWPRTSRGSNSSKNCSSTKWSHSDAISLDMTLPLTKVGVVDLHNTRQHVAVATDSTDVSVTSSTDGVEESLSLDDQAFPALFVEVSNDSGPGEEENDVPTTDTVKRFKSMTARLDALRIQQQLQGMNHPDVIFSMNRLGRAKGLRDEAQKGKSSRDAANRRLVVGLRGCGASRRLACQKLSHEWY